MASIVVKTPEHASQVIDRVLAFVLSFERIYNTDSLLIRVAEVKRYDDKTMMSGFKFEPLMEAGAFTGSLTHAEHTVYLIKKNNSQYLRLQHYEILNTEIRSLLFKHSYGYDMSLLDFGKLQSIE